MPGRGRGMIEPNKNLRRPSSGDPTTSSLVDGLVDKILAVKSPDDLEVATIALEIKSSVTEEDDLRNLVTKLCDNALIHIDSTPVIGAVFGSAQSHHVGDVKLRSLLLQRVQNDYTNRENRESQDRQKFVASAMFLGEIMYFLKSDKGVPFKVLAEPVVNYLSMITGPHIHGDAKENVDEDMVVVAKQLLQNGRALYDNVPTSLEAVVRDVTQIMICHSLSDVTRLNVLAALGELWPVISQTLNSRSLHASLATQLGLSFKI